MSAVVDRAAATAIRLVSKVGGVASFTRTIAGEYDPIGGGQADETVLAWSGVAILDEITGSRDGQQVPGPSDRRVTMRPLLVAGRSLPRVPAPGDVVSFNGVVYSVVSVEPIGDVDGSQAPLYRLGVSA